MQTQLEYFPDQSFDSSQQPKRKGKSKNIEREKRSVQSKKAMKREKNRIAAQKSRDRKQEYIENMERENQQLKIIVGRCAQCTQAFQQFAQSQDFDEEVPPPILEERQAEEELPALGTAPTWKSENILLREEDSNSSNVNKYFWLCLLAVVICVYCANKDGMGPARMVAELNPSPNNIDLVKGNTKGGNKKQGSSKIRSKGKEGSGGNIRTDSDYIEGSTNKIIRSYLNSKQKGQSTSNKNGKKPLKNLTAKNGAKCMYITSNNTFENYLTTTNQNSTNTVNTTAVNSTRQILFCKSKALFFKKMSHELKSETNEEVGIVQTTGKNLQKFMDKECLNGSQIDDDQLYNIQFTVTMMVLSPVKKSRPKSPLRHFTVNE